VGRAYITGSPDTYVYKDSADLLALIAGGGSMNIFGEHVGGETWKFKNEFMLDTLKTSAGVMERRCEVVIQLGSEYVNQGCRDKYLELKTSLGDVGSRAGGDYSDVSDMTLLRQALTESSGLWETLVDLGCERYGS
jgi:hypothetical protein